MTRRTLIAGSSVFAAGAVSAMGGRKVASAATAEQPLPLTGGFAPATHPDRRTPPKHSHTSVRWAVDTTQQLVALTFDDGPRPEWTPEVLDILDEYRVPATFFMVGRRVRKYAATITGRLAPHEAANHTWDHVDLARRTFDQARDDLARAHAAISAVTGQEPTLMRPPYGHVGGSALLAAAEMGYGVAMWSVQMLESEYADNPPGLVDYIVGAAAPGSIILAHDIGEQDRLVALRNLPRMITGLRRRGFELVTASDLIARG